MMKTQTRCFQLSRLLACVALAVSSVAPVRAASIVLDNFQNGPFTLSAPAGSGTGADQPAAGAAGGYRAETLLNPNGPPNGAPIATATLIAPGGGITVNSGYVSFSLGYGERYNGGSSMAASGGTALNLNLTNTDRIRFDLTAITGSMRIYASFQTFNGGFLNNGNAGDPAFFVSSPGIVDLPYSMLRTPGGGAASNYSLADVDFIVLTFQPNPGVSFTLAGISIVPEPGSSTVISIVGALAALHCVQRRRRGRLSR